MYKINRNKKTAEINESELWASKCTEENLQITALNVAMPCDTNKKEAVVNEIDNRHE